MNIKAHEIRTGRWARVFLLRVVCCSIVTYSGTLPAAEPNYGYIPRLNTVTRLLGTNRARLTPAMIGAAPAPTPFPAMYELYTKGRLSPVKDQNPFGTCWAHAAFGSLESCLLTNEYWDFSEKNLVNRHGFDYGPNEGGNAWMSMAYLTRWDGPVDEADDPYPWDVWDPWDPWEPKWDYSSPAGPVRKHVQDVLLIPGKTSDLDNDAIKAAIMNYGAVLVSYYHDNSWYASRYATYNYPGSPDTDSNHEVVIFGWDDNFPLDRFSSKPPGNGAYMVKNSWGQNWGQYGFFFVSYYDTVFARSDMFVFRGAESVTNYNVHFEYDPLGWVSERRDPWAANIYTATSSVSLKAVGFYILWPGETYYLDVYKGVTDGAPKSGKVGCSMSGALEPGFHTVQLSTPVNLTNGQKFSIVLRVSNGPHAVEHFTLDGNGHPYSSRATAAPGQSFYSMNGTGWIDLTTWDPTANFCIKAYGYHESIPPTFTNLAATPAVARPGTIVTNTFTASEPLATNPTVLVNGHMALPMRVFYTNYWYRYLVQGADPEGGATIVITGTDVQGNTGSFTNKTALVVDKTAPAIICPPDLILKADPGHSSRANVTFEVTATDNLGLASLRQLVGLPSGSTFPVGTTTNIFVATDNAGNSNTCIATVQVDESLPLLVVTSTNDRGLGTLRDALSSAMEGQYIDVTRVSGTILLTNGPLTIDKGVTIVGPGPSVLAVSGNNAARVFEVTGMDVTISGLAIVNGVGKHGGGIYNHAAHMLTITNCTISGNFATNLGGGICSSNASLSIVASTICSNSAYTGGGICNDGCMGNAMMYVTACTIHDNSANWCGGILNVSDSTGDGVGNASATIMNSTISSHSGFGTGGIANESAWGGTAGLTINACTFNSNSGAQGGAIYSDGRFGGNAWVQIGDTILNAGASGENILNVEGSVLSQGFNLSSDNGGGHLTNTCDQINTHPFLGPLQNNGGLTWTHAPCAGSPARDKGKINVFPTMPCTNDQRGVARPYDNPYVPNATNGGDGSDIGAVELKDVVTVCSTAEGGPDSLRTAIAYAQDGDTIHFSVGGTITLTNELMVSRGVRLVGPEPGALTVSGNKLYRVFDVTGTNVVISGLTIANGQGTNDGAGIKASGTGSSLSLVNCILTNNSTTGSGGGVFTGSGATLSVSNCMVMGNHGGMGGGICNYGGYLTVVGSTVSSNSAISGGGIDNTGLSGRACIINACTICSNIAPNGAGLYNFGWYSGTWPLIVNSCTFAGNIASYGVSIYNSGMGSPGSGALQLANNIFDSGPWGGANFYNNYGTVMTKGYNLSCDNGSGFLTNATDRTNSAPRLGPLRDNGGPTWTMALLPGSPAIDQGKRDAVTNLVGNVDQRGFQRPSNAASVTNAGDGSDIGAYEVQCISVTSINDAGPGTLRDALARAVENTMIEATGIAGTISLTTGPLLISKSVVILGPGPAALTVSGSSLSRVFEVTGKNVIISGLRIAEGQSDNGGGIFNGGGVTMILSNCLVCGNGANTWAGCGGGIYNSNSSLSIIACTISSNSAIYGGKGGGIYNETRGGRSTLAIQASTLAGNSASWGGGVYNLSANSGQTNTIVNSTFSGNVSDDGGAAIHIDGPNWGDTAYVTINSSTLSGNSSGGPGGAGIAILGYDAWLVIGNTILNAGSCGPTLYTALTGVVLDEGYNLSSDGAAGWLFRQTSQLYKNPQLGPLKDNGGLTWTHAISHKSPVVDRGKRNANDEVPTTTDQRGLSRPVLNPYLPNASDAGGDGSDIGAFEIQGSGGYDTDADGLPDFWELAYFGNLSQSGTDDPDHDGNSNMFEYMAGLDPANAYSIFALEIANVPGQPKQKAITFAPWAPGRTYTPQFSTNLQGATTFSPLIGYGGPTTNEDRVTFIDTHAVEPRKYYRIQISLP